MGWLFEDENERKAKAEKVAMVASKLNSVQDELRHKLEGSSLLRIILEEWTTTSTEESCRWMLHTKGYSDCRERTIAVTKETIYVLDCKKTELSQLGATLSKAAITAVFGTFSNAAMNKAIQQQAAADKAADDLASRNSYLFNYTAYGYLPLQDYRNPSGSVVDSYIGIKIWTSVIAESLQKSFPSLNINEEVFSINYDLFGGHAYGISYTVPDYPWKSWF